MSGRNRLAIVGAGVAIVAIAIVVIVLVTSGGGDPEPGPAPSAGVPEPIETALAPAARAAGCVVRESRIEGSEHTSEPVEYRTNPPTSGDHDPVAAEDGLYDSGNSPDVEQSVHALEHGRINLQYRKGTPAERIAQLETVASEPVKGDAGYHTLLFENQTGMQPALVATAWGQSLSCPDYNDRVFDAVRAFRSAFVDKGPEFIP
jgi:hypothetical protein